MVCQSPIAWSFRDGSRTRAKASHAKRPSPSSASSRSWRIGILGGASSGPETPPTLEPIVRSPPRSRNGQGLRRKEPARSADEKEWGERECGLIDGEDGGAQAKTDLRMASNLL